MILVCNYEEVTALTHGAHALLAHGEGEGASVAAPSTVRTAVEFLLPRLTGDISVRTLAEQRRIERAVAAVVEHFRERMEAHVVTAHPADELAVGAYFDFAHALSVLGRIQEMGREMGALVEVMTGEPPTPEVLRTFVFPD